jgi:hypothetical protein
MQFGLKSKYKGQDVVWTEVRVQETECNVGKLQFKILGIVFNFTKAVMFIKYFNVC